MCVDNILCHMMEQHNDNHFGMLCKYTENLQVLHKSFHHFISAQDLHNLGKRKIIFKSANGNGQVS